MTPSDRCPAQRPAWLHPHDRRWADAGAAAQRAARCTTPSSTRSTAAASAVGDHWLADFASCNYLGFDLDPEIIGRDRRAGAPLGHPPELVAAARQPAAVPGDRGAADRAAGRPGHAGAADHHPHPHVGDARARRRRHVLPGRAGAQDHLRRVRCTPARPGATVHRFRPTTSTSWRAAARGAGRRARGWSCMDGVNSMTGNPPDLAALARLCREHDALLYVDDAHGFGVIGERRPDETSPYGLRGNAIVRYSGETYDNIVLVGGFSKAYSSLLAFLAVPTWLRTTSRWRRRRTSTPGRRRRRRWPRCWPASTSTTSAATRSAPTCTARPSGCSTTSTRSACYTPNTRGTPDHRAAAGRRPRTSTPSAGCCGSAGIYVTLARVPAGAARPGRLPGAGDRGQHRRARSTS